MLYHKFDRKRNKFLEYKFRNIKYYWDRKILSFMYLPLYCPYRVMHDHESRRWQHWQLRVKTVVNLISPLKSSLNFHYKSIEDKSCSTWLAKCFERIYMFTSYELFNHVSVLQRFVTCFSKGFTAKVSVNLKKKGHRKMLRNLECLKKQEAYRFI